jgi:nitroreductase
MKDALDFIKARRSVRKFTPMPVPSKLLDRVVEAGLYAPTGHNRQTTVILKITDPETVRKLGKVNGEIFGKLNGGNPMPDGFYGAPVVLCVLSPKDNSTKIWDGSSVISSMALEASSLGLGSCWVHRGREQFETEYGKSLLLKAGIDPEVYEGIDNLIVGWPEAVPAAPPRKPGRVFSL